MRRAWRIGSVAALLDGTLGYTCRAFRFNPPSPDAISLGGSGGCGLLGRLNQRRRRVRADDDAAAAEDERRHRRDVAPARIGGRVAQGGLAGSGVEGGVHAGRHRDRRRPQSSRSTAGSPMFRFSVKLALKMAVWKASKRSGASVWAQALAASARWVFTSSDVTASAGRSRSPRRRPGAAGAPSSRRARRARTRGSRGGAPPAAPRDGSRRGARELPARCARQAARGPSRGGPPR